MTLGLGVAAVSYGAFTAHARAKNPSSFKKLGPMKQIWGDRAGTVMHVVAYTIVPLVVGVLLLVGGYAGVSIGDF